ncbi:hypothetical protein TSUD_63800 [Trifolium subterraneum]|uniref:Reverse transcriptase domain-containing protein n=1 Tax=Trifolium subterraneum TaxID=3900 RepID=A0A2Z6NGV1_TRISU|nr:hypothetical protein TSUD_63800 [Trifolium subterraneum]
MRGREPKRGAAPRAFLGRPFRSPPSPEVRHKRGGVYDDSGEWTVVRNRRRKALREAEDVDDRRRQYSDTLQQFAEVSKHRHPFFDDQFYRYQARVYEHDHRHSSLNQTRYSRGNSREFRRHVSSNRNQNVRSDSWNIQIARREESKMDGCDRRQQEDVEISGRVFTGRHRESKTAVKDFYYSGRDFEQQDSEHGGNLGSNLKRYVSFYFTNFPAQFSNFYLRKGFEVCGILEDVFVANKRNRFGEPYGFVKFSNVRDITKMTKALNDVWFGHFRVRAKVAKFERNDVGKDGRLQKEKVGLLKDSVVKMKKDVIHNPRGNVVITSEEVRTKPTAKNTGVGKDGPGYQGELGDGLSPKGVDMSAAVAQEKENRILLRNYRTKPEDVQWVNNGLVATVLNGEAIPVVQNRITDAGFKDVDIIPMGADKVFVRSSEGVDVMSIVSSANEFFRLVFSNWTRWDKELQPYHRGAWIRLYGVPLNAWNVNFFKLCMFNCGRFLRADLCSADKDRLDFARVLIATPFLDIISRVEKVMVDGVLVEIKMVEEWGYALGEDTCLFEEETETEASQSDCDEGHADPDVCRNVDMLIDKITVGLEEAATEVVLGKSGVECQDKLFRDTSGVGDCERENEQREDILSPVGIQTEVQKVGPIRDAGDRDFKTGNPSLQTVSQDGSNTWKIRREFRRDAGSQPCNNRATSCPPAESRSATSGPWSWEWLQDHDHGDAGVIFSARKRVKEGGRLGLRHKREGHLESKRRKAGGVLRHPIQSLKKVARLPQEDRVEVLKVLNKSILWRRKRDNRVNAASSQANSEESSSSDSVNNDWKNWVAMQGNDQMVMDDVRGIGHSLGVKFRGDAANMFNVLSREGKSKKDRSGASKVKGWDGLTMSRLDRFLLSEEWCLAWPNCTQTARLRGLSDHCSLVLSANEDDWGPRPSRMLKCWRDVPGYKLFVKDKWNSFQIDGWGGYVLKEKLRRIKTALKDWHTAHAQNLPSRIESLKVRLSTLDQKGEEEYQLATVTFVVAKGGDANTKYFHTVLAGRRRGNAISMLQADGVALEGVNPIRQAVFSHFASHFKAINVERPGVDNLHFKRLSQVECSSLTKPFSEGEVKSAVWDCDSYKSPGPDGINFGFIKDFWVELRGDVMRFITGFHRNGKLTKGLNSTFIALIPKVDSPQRLNDFRPISLVSSLYKILAKVLANRLRLVIGSVISESQTAFVKERQILDGYLDDVMGRMSFPVLWRKWIKECVCTAIASVLVNGSPTDEFSLERGLRQGDPLSPFLFLLAAEGLNVLMETAVARNLFTGYSIGDCDPILVSHLQFADDTLLLGVKSWANVRALRAVLVLFESMSGLKVNFHKSMLVGVNISESWLGEAASALCCKVGKIPFFYLGLAIGGDPRRLSFWDPVLDRLKNKLSGWKSRFLSFGGRLVLLNLSGLCVFGSCGQKEIIAYFGAPLVAPFSCWIRSSFSLFGG